MKANTNPIKELFKKFAFRYTPFGRPNYPYTVEPILIATIINEIERLKGIPGNLVEIGVARGMTTRLICEHLINQRIHDQQTFFCLDTFSSFTEKDLQFEIEKRGKTRKELSVFAYNDYEVWRRNFSEFPFVKPIETDCAEFDYRILRPIKLVFLDVDLYLPTKKTLPKIYEQLVNGGVILVDDTMDQCSWDGAYHAYMEFCQSERIPPRIIGNRCGLLYKL